ncbi:basic membrane lipoprotein, putative [Bodo saltans]|uniref:Basic membrane lipoprotein, putative n=1 Tax=Bodo saltans TaxID=75058 RepID=A0A0S4J2R5_BODSA|nr:basic membrane lipoprotein, putative [Bodo saltans]|eukprot:CUG06369.1 basic membrane lipoprotein, putative [Bodo saltans]
MDTQTTDSLAAALRPLFHVVASASLVGPIFLVAQQLVPNLTITVMDPVDVPDSLANRTQVIALRDDQVGFLAGVVAGAQSISGSVAYVGGPRGSAINNMRAGFFNGVISVCPSCAILVTNLLAFSRLAINDTAITAAVRTRGPDVVWCAGGSGGSAVLTDLALASVAVIGVDADEFTTTLATYANTTSATFLLTSSMKLSGTAAGVAVRGLIADPKSYVLQNRIIGAPDNVIALAPCHTSCSRWSGRANDSAKLTQTGLQSGRQSTGVNIDTGAITFDRKETSISVIRPPISAAQQVDLVPGYVQVVSCWGLMVIFDGQWNRLATYDDSLMTVVPILIVDPPTPVAPVLGGGYTLVVVTVNNATGQEAIILTGGVQHSVVANRSFSLMTACQAPGTCTDRASWRRINSSVAADDTGLTVPPMMYHAASSRPGTNTFYVAGGRTSNGTMLQAMWRVQCTLANNSTTQVLCIWSMLNTRLPSVETLFNFTLALWLNNPAVPWREDPLDIFVLAGGGARILMWSTPFDEASLGWVDDSAALNALGLTARQRPCVYRHDARVIVLLGLGGSGESVFLLPDKSLTSAARLFVDVREGMIPSVLTTLTQDTLSCDVLQPDVEVTPTSVAFSGWDTSLLHAAYRQVFMVDMNGSTSTAGLLGYSMPVISCDAKRHLVRSSTLEQCVICPSNVVENDVCPPPSAVRDDGDGNNLSTGSIIGIVAGVIVAFVLGLLAGGMALGVGIPLHHLRTVPPPLQFPLAFVFVALANTSKSWQREAQSAAMRVKHFRAAVSSVAAKHSCYEVRILGDSCLLVASKPQDALQFSLALLSLRRDSSRVNDATDNSVGLMRRTWHRLRPQGDTWPEDLPVRIVVHYGSRVEIRTSHNGMYDYFGPDVDETIAARWCVDGALREVAISGAAQAALANAKVELSKQKDVALSESVGSSSYKILRCVHDSGLRKHPSATEIIVNGGAVPMSVMPTASIDDIKVDLPDFTMEDDVDIGGMSMAMERKNGDRSHPAPGGTLQSSTPRGASSQVPVDPMHVLNAIESQQLTQIVSWALEAAAAPLPEQQRAKFLKRLCHQNIVTYDAVPPPTASKTHNAGANASGGGRTTPSQAKVSSTSLSSSTATATTGGALHKVAASLLRQMDTLELRTILTHLSTNADEGQRLVSDAPDEWETSAPQRPRSRSTGSKGTPLQRAASTGREDW